MDYKDFENLNYLGSEDTFRFGCDCCGECYICGEGSVKFPHLFFMFLFEPSVSHSRTICFFFGLPFDMVIDAQ